MFERVPRPAPASASRGGRGLERRQAVGELSEASLVNVGGTREAGGTPSKPRSRMAKCKERFTIWGLSPAPQIFSALGLHLTMQFLGRKKLDVEGAIRWKIR